MASNPGILTEWPWQRLGNFKYVVLAPWVAQSLYSAVNKGWAEVDLTNLAIFPSLLLRLLHSQVWISLSRFQTAHIKHRIVNKPIEFDQVDRERNWDDQIIFNGLLFYLGNAFLPGASHLPIWRTDGVVLTFLLHAGPVEFLYYWLHRALHHHFLYSRYHSHHHASVVTEPITSVIHPFAEHLAYFALFSIPMLATLYAGTMSSLGLLLYLFYIDFMNNLGHCNFEVVPKRLFDVFPFLKYLMYTPSFHSLHHTQFRSNYSLFMPFYDYIYGTMDKSTDDLYERSLEGKEETLQLVYLTHPTTLQSIYHLRLGFASLASKPYAYKWYMLFLWPMAYLSMLLTWIYGSTFILERNSLKQLNMQTWAIPRFSYQYQFSWEKEAINGLIEKAILDAEGKGVKVVNLGLLNQGVELNNNGELYIQKFPLLKTRIVDGSSLAVAVVLHSISLDTTRVLLRGSPSKMAFALVFALSKRNVQIMVVDKEEYHALESRLPKSMQNYLVYSNSYTAKIWIIGDGLTDEEQSRATKGTHIIPFSQFPPRKLRDDCVYYSTPAMTIPKSMVNVDSCENWLPRRVMSAWRIAGILHAVEGWNQHECGDTMLDVEKVWSSALHHGFLPLAPL